MPETDLVGKKGLCEALGWSRPTLDKRLVSDPAFPVESRGGKSGGWLFSIRKARAHLDGRPARPAAAINMAQLRDAVRPASQPPKMDRRAGESAAEASARNRKETAQADLLESKLAHERGELLDRSDTRQLLAGACAQLAQDLEGWPEEIAKDNGLPDEAVRKLRDYLDSCRREFHRRLMSLLADA